MRKALGWKTHALAAVAAIGASLAAGQTMYANDQGGPPAFGLAGRRVIGLTDDGRLVRFRAGAPRRTREIGWSYILAIRRPTKTMHDAPCIPD